MEFTVKKVALVEELKKVNRAIEGNVVVPVLTGVLLSVDENGLSMTGSNGDLSIKTFLPVTEEDSDLDVKVKGEVILPGKKFTQVVRSLSDGEVSISMKENNSVIIKSGKARFTLSGEDGKDYPKLPTLKEKQVIEVETEVLIEVLRRTGYAISKIDTRPILTGVNLFFNEGKFGAISTDSHRLAKVEGVQFEGDGFDFSVVIPDKTVKELPLLIADSKKVSVYSDGVQFVVKSDGVEAYTRILEGNFPETSRLIPTEFTTEVTVSRYEFLSALERVTILSAAQENSMVQMNIGDANDSMFESFSLSSSSDSGTSKEEVLVTNTKGDDLDISFNGRYMIEALKNITEEVVNICFSGVMRPFVLNPVDGDNKTTKLILPVRRY